MLSIHQHSSLWAALLFIALFLCAAFPHGTIAPPLGNDPRSFLPGVWDWEGPESCQANTHTITFSDIDNKMILTFQESLTPSPETGKVIYAYDIISVQNNSIIAIMENEHRLTASGTPIVWELTMFSQNVYRWRQTDWKPSLYTGAVVRCSGETPSDRLIKRKN